MSFSLKKTKAFTLVEMLIVVFVITALVAVLGPAQQYIFKDTEKTSMQANARGITDAAAQYLAEHDSLPVTNEPVTVTDKNVEHIIKEQLKSQGVNDTVFNSLNGEVFKKIDEKAISSYIKGDKSNLGDYFIVDKVDNITGYKNNLLGYVFTLEAYATHEGGVFSGEFTAVSQPDGPTVCPEPWVSQGYTCIGKPNELDDIRNQADVNGRFSGKYVLVKDIDMSGFQNFKPIGMYDANGIVSSFIGTFDGNGKKITGLTIKEADGHGVGLFSRIAGGTVQNLTIEANVDLTNAPTYDHVGILAGYTDTYGGEVTISNVHASGNVTAPTSTSVGGLIGTVAKSSLAYTIDNSSFNGNVTGNHTVGGFVGKFNNNPTVTNSHSAGTVFGNVEAIGGFAGLMTYLNKQPVTNNYSTAKVTGGTYSNKVGGFVGDAYQVILRNNYATGDVVKDGISGYRYGGFIGHLRNNGQIYNSYATGNVTSAGTHNGGFVGEVGGTTTISDSYARGNVNGPSASGFAGLINGSVVKNSYSTGLVTGSGTLGGFASKISGTNTLTSNYWDVTTSGVSTSAAGTGMTTPQMKQQATFTGWDFTNIWSIDETLAYPILR